MKPLEPTPGAPLYRLRGVRFSHDGVFRLKVEDLEIAAGEKLAIVGHNGSGKTTLLRILARLTPPDEAAEFLHPPEARPGFLRQQPYLFNESVAANLAYPLRLRRLPRETIAARVSAMLARLDLSDFAARSAARLSGGERKRLALGRVLIAEPEVLLLDEPDAHLDRHSNEVILRTLSDLPATLIMTTHDLSFAQHLAQRIIHLRGGRIIPGLPVNQLAGTVRGKIFTTRGGLEIHCAQAPGERPVVGEHSAAAYAEPGATRLAIDPRHIVLSHEALDSSMRNQFRGTIASVRDENGAVWIEIALGGERVTAIVSRASYERLALNVNREVMVSFKAHAVETW